MPSILETLKGAVWFTLIIIRIDEQIRKDELGQVVCRLRKLFLILIFSILEKILIQLRLNALKGL